MKISIIFLAVPVLICFEKNFLILKVLKHHEKKLELKMKFLKFPGDIILPELGKK